MTSQLQPVAREYINQAQAAAALIIQESTVCFFGIYESVPIPHGSGVLVQIDNAHFIFTAAHVATFAKNQTILTVADLASPGDFLTMAGGSIVTSSGDGSPSDLFDIAVILLPDATAARLATTKTFLRLSMLDANHHSARDTWYYLQGFPSAHAMPDIETSKVVARYLRVGGLRKDPAQTDFNANVYIDVAAPVTDMVDQDNKPITIKHTDGVSGCGVWSLFTVSDIRSGAWEARLLRYIGILHTWPAEKEYFRATRVEYALQMIAREWPELVPAMRVSLNVSRPLDVARARGLYRFV